METRIGDWQQTYTGRKFWAMDPRVDEVDILDIAHALSMQCRFGGHCNRFYSVAEHCFLMSYAAAPADALWALMHDASEAYLVDVPRPVKPFLAGYHEAEAAVMAVVCQRFGLDVAMPGEVKILDGRMLTTEKEALMNTPPVPWFDSGPALNLNIFGWDPATAELRFLSRFYILYRRHLNERIDGLRADRSWASMSDDRAFTNGTIAAINRGIEAASVELEKINRDIAEHSDCADTASQLPG